MLYITHTQLMRESEQSVQYHAANDTDLMGRVCKQVVASDTRYAVWHSRHERRMLSVVSNRRKEDQLLRLRGVAVEQVHRTALVNYLRDSSVVGAARDRVLSEFYGLVDPRSSVVMEHRNYLVSASSQISALDVLESASDCRGVKMIANYEVRYGQFFRMFCERLLAEQSGLIYILNALIDEVNDSAVKMRARILHGELLPVSSNRR